MIRFIIALLFVLLLSACDTAGDAAKPADDTPGKGGASQGSVSQSSVSPGAAESAKAASPPKIPAFKQFADAPAAALGTLPEGVGLAVGTQAPDLVATTASGKTLQLGKLFAAQRTLVVFYRGGWCPYCNTQVRSLSRAIEKFNAIGITPLLVSVDKASEASKTQAKYEIPFPVLSDPSLALHKAFAVLNVVPEKMVKALAGYGIDLEAASGQAHHTIAIPSVFLVEKGGRISFAHAERDYKVRPRTDSLLKALAKIPAGG